MASRLLTSFYGIAFMLGLSSAELAEEGWLSKPSSEKAARSETCMIIVYVIACIIYLSYDSIIYIIAYMVYLSL